MNSGDLEKYKRATQAVIDRIAGKQDDGDSIGVIHRHALWLLENQVKSLINITYLDSTDAGSADIEFEHLTLMRYLFEQAARILAERSRKRSAVKARVES